MSAVRTKVILAAPGTGKTHWILRTRGTNYWMDMDEWAKVKGLHDEDWHNHAHDEQQTEEHYRKIDRELERSTGLRLIGSLYWEFVPDAIVLIGEETHQAYVNRREDLTWDDVKPIVENLKALARKHRVPTFDSFEAATAHVDRVDNAKRLLPSGGTAAPGAPTPEIPRPKSALRI